MQVTAKFFHRRTVGDDDFHDAVANSPCPAASSNFRADDAVPFRVQSLRRRTIRQSLAAYQPRQDILQRRW